MDTLSTLEKKLEIAIEKRKETDKKYKLVDNDLKYRKDKYTAKQIASKNKKKHMLLKKSIAYINYAEKIRSKIKALKDKQKSNSNNPFVRNKR